MPKIQMRRDTAANWRSVNPVLLAGEWALDTDSRFMKIGDGTTAYNALPYSTAEDKDWQKPSDWIDIRSGALPNSVYFLVGHSAPVIGSETDPWTITSYPTFGVRALTTDNSSYDVYVDGVKVITSAHNTTTTLDWRILKLNTGYDTTYPEALHTHIVRITPTASTSKLANTQCQYNRYTSGLLWAHYSIDYPISLYCAFAADYFSVGYCDRLVAVTASGNKIMLNNASNALESTFVNALNLQTVPVIEGQEGVQYNLYCAFSQLTGSVPKHFHLKNITADRANSAFYNSTGNNLKFTFENCYLSPSNNMYGGQTATSTRSFLKKLPTFNSSAVANLENFLVNAVNLEPTLLDFAAFTNTTKLDVHGSSTARMDGLKGLTVSNEAPFDNATSPQLNVNYTGLDRAALVNLFKSMPYNVGYSVVGSPTITNGVVSGFTLNDYIQTPPLPQNITSLHIHVDATNNEYLSGVQGIFMIGDSTSLEFRGSSFRDYITGIDGTVSTHGWVGSTYTYGTPVEVDCYFENGTTRFVVKQNGITPLDVSYTDTKINASPVFYGRRWGGLVNGSINLNNTYIKVNGVPWFTGKAAMTKTCSVVGCSGTADLTQEDKNIVLNKGWSLTVA